MRTIIKIQTEKSENDMIIKLLRERWKKLYKERSEPVVESDCMERNQEYAIRRRAYDNMIWELKRLNGEW